MRLLVFAASLLLLGSVAEARTTHPQVRMHAARRVRAVQLRRGMVRRAARRPRWWRAALLSPIHGSRESLVRQNMMVDGDQLERIQDDTQLLELTTSQSLVPLPAGRDIRVEEALPENRRFCRPWTKSFLQAFAEAHWMRFHKPLQINSAVRTVEFQSKLRRVNGNAAGLEGDTASPHLTGATVDVAKTGMTRAELKWARDYLFGLQNQGKLDAEEEFRQPVFHITVYKAFAPETKIADSTEMPEGF